MFFFLCWMLLFAAITREVNKQWEQIAVRPTFENCQKMLWPNKNSMY